VAHRRANIIQYVKTPWGRWRWEPIPKNRRTGSYAWSEAKSTQFYVVWREGNKRRYAKAGSTPAQALEAKKRKEFELAGRAALGEGKKIPKRDSGITIDEAVEDFLNYIKTKRRPSTYRRYRAVMAHFRGFFRVHALVDSITLADIDAFRDVQLGKINYWGRKNTPRNVNYEVATIRAFYYYLQKFRDPSLANPAARLRPLQVTRSVVDTYDERELERFFSVCTEEERAIYKTFAYTGLREQELAYLYWADLNLRKGILTLRAKRELGFIPKDWEEREIPLHPELLQILTHLPHKHENLVFPSLRGNPNGHLLRLLIKIVKRGKLPGHWYLHKFRKTFATRALENADIRTVQALLGHKNITTTARYLSTSTDKMRQAVAKL
jgi:integrase